MVNRSKKGDRAERELVNMFHEANFASIRVPASGGATKRELPDVHVGNGTDTYSIECKRRDSGSFYVGWDEVFGLLLFSNMMGSKARIGARFDREDWKFYHPSDLHQTYSGSRRVDQDSDVEHETFEDLL